MKRIVSLLLSAALLLALLPACQGLVTPSKPTERQPAALEVADAMLPVSGYSGQSGNLEYLTAGEDGNELLTVYLESAYGLPAGTWEDAAIIRAAGASAFELAVLHLENVDDAIQAAARLTAYISSRRGDFVGYAPEQADMVANGDIARDGTYAALCICPDPGQAMAAFHGLVSGDHEAGPRQSNVPPEVTETEPAASVPAVSEPTASEPVYVPDYSDRYPFVQPNQDDMSLYDTSAILTAWISGDPSPLSGYDQDIYYASKKVLDKILKDGMSDLEKETAVYKWIVNNVNYDWTHQDVLRETPRESFTPYGGLVNHTAVCLGYATTFQLLMDLAGVECITVVGAASESQEDHGWNRVRLNGHWYCVDVTWDANYREYGVTRGREKDWMFFNITSDEMAKTDHQWDYANTPEAVTAGNGRS